MDTPDQNGPPIGEVVKASFLGRMPTGGTDYYANVQNNLAARDRLEEQSGAPDAPDATKEQNAPVPNEEPTIHEQVCEDIMERQRVGVETYGQPLQPNNGRDALVDAYQEALDLACYLKQSLVEQASDSNSIYKEAVTRVRALLEGYQKSLGRYTMVNAQQIMDLLDPNGLWSTSGSDSE